MPLAIMGVALGAGIIGSSIISSNAAKKAASVQAAGVDQGIALNEKIFNQNQSNYEQSRTDSLAAQAKTQPWITAGSGALQKLSDALGLNGPSGSSSAASTFQKSPGYDFAFNEGQRAVNTSAASKGLFASGGRGKALVQYGQGQGNQEFGGWLGKLAAVSGYGQTAVGQNIGAASAIAGNTAANNNSASAFGVDQAGLYGDAAAARASGYVGSANAISGGVNNLAKLAGTYYGANGGGLGGAASKATPVQDPWNWG